jgi:hypothetical protein
MPAATPPALARCLPDNSSTAPPPWWNDLLSVQRQFQDVGRRFERSVLDESEQAERGSLGGRAIRLLRRVRDLRGTAAGTKEVDLHNLAALTSMCNWRKSALKYVRQLLAHPDCGSDKECFCQQSGRVVSLLRQLKGDEVTDRYFSTFVVARCPFASSWQMPTPTSSYAHWLEGRPFWEPSNFAIGALLTKHRQPLLEELQSMARRQHGLWRTHEPGGPADQDPELVESGWWRQLSIYREPGGWNQTVCSQIPETCSLLRRFNESVNSATGERELGGKVKLFELGGRSSLLPHFGPTNTRLLLPFAVTVPGGATGGGETVGGDGDDGGDVGLGLGGSSSSCGGSDGASENGRCEVEGARRLRAIGTHLRVGKETRAWREPGQMMVFDDSFEHDVKNYAEGSRVVLAIQLKHPHLRAGTVNANGGWTYAPP